VTRVYVHMYIYICNIHAYIYICIYTCMHTHTRAYIYVYICLCMYIYTHNVCMYMFTHVHTSVFHDKRYAPTFSSLGEGFYYFGIGARLSAVQSSIGFACAGQPCIPLCAFRHSQVCIPVGSRAGNKRGINMHKHTHVHLFLLRTL